MKFSFKAAGRSAGKIFQAMIGVVTSGVALVLLFSYTPPQNLFNPAQAIEFGKAWVAADDNSPPYDEIVNGALYKDSKDDKELSLFGSHAIDMILSRYGNTVDKSYFLEQQSDCYLRAGDRAKAISAATRALYGAKAVTDYSPEKLRTYSQKSQSLNSPATQPSN